MLDRPDPGENGHTAEDIARLDGFLGRIGESIQVEYDYTGVGYFETIAHPEIPTDRIVVHPVGIYGKVDECLLGFVFFFEDGKLLIDCHSLSEMDCPPDARERGISVIDERGLAT